MMKKFLTTATLPAILGLALGFISLFLNLNLQIALATLLLGAVLGGQLESLRRDQAADPRAAIETVAQISAPLAASMSRMLENAPTSLSDLVGESAMLDKIISEFDELNGLLARARAGHLEVESTDAAILPEWARKETLSISGTAFTPFAVSWRRSSRGEAFWAAQVAAISRGVKIRRLFIYETVTRELQDLVHEQTAAGIQCRLIKVTDLEFPFIREVTIFDHSRLQEAYYGTEGRPWRDRYSVVEAEVRAALTEFDSAFDRATEIGFLTSS
jgi:hypothetical protein